MAVWQYPGRGEGLVVIGLAVLLLPLPTLGAASESKCDGCRRVTYDT